MPRRHNTTTSPKKVAHDDRLSQMMQARIKGRSWEQIAADFGYTEATNAQRALKRFIEQQTTDITEEYRAVINGRFELLFNAYWQQALSGDMNAAYFVRDILIQLGRFNGVGTVKVEQNVTQNNVMIMMPTKEPIPQGIARIIEGESDVVE